jgi:integration host factor subunit beta
MTKSQLIDAVADRKGLARKEAEVVVNTVLQEIANALLYRNRVELRGFGSFSVKIRPAREGRNPKTGSVVRVSEKVVPFFKAGKELRQRVDN